MFYGGLGIPDNLAKLHRLYDAGEYDTTDQFLLLVIEVEGSLIGTMMLRTYGEPAEPFGNVRNFDGGPMPYLDRGYGSEASTLLFDYAFAVLGYHKINLDLFEYNVRAQAMYEKLGFVVEGRRRENHWSRGRFWDDILMGVTAEEWWSKARSPRLPGWDARADGSAGALFYRLSCHRPARR